MLPYCSQSRFFKILWRLVEPLINGFALSATVVFLSFMAVATKSPEFGAIKSEALLTFLILGLAVAAVFAAGGAVISRFRFRAVGQAPKRSFGAVPALFFLIITVFWPQSYGVFDGSEFIADYSLAVWGSALWPYAAALALSLACVYFFASWSRFISGIILASVLLFFVFTPVQNVEQKGSYKTSDSFKPLTDVNLLSKNKNIIIIVFDALGGQVVNHILQKNEMLKGRFKDFVFYPRAVSISTKTSIAVPIIFNGVMPSMDGPYLDSTHFTKEGLQENSILKYAEKHGYTQKLLVHAAYYPGYYGVSSGYDLNSLAAKPESSYLATTFSILLRCLARVLPVQLVAPIYNNPQMLHYNALEALASKYPEKAYSILALPKLVHSLRAGQEEPVFLLTHTLLTHGPFVFNEEFQLTGRGDIITDQEYGLRLAADLIERLQEINVYDDSLIIFCGDHGHDLEVPSLIAPSAYAEFYASLPAEYVKKGEATSTAIDFNPLLMIKYPQSITERLTVIDHNVSTTALYDFLRQAITATPESPLPFGAFDSVEAPIKVIIQHKDDYGGISENQYQFNLLQLFEAPDGLDSIAKIVREIKPRGQTAK